MTVNRSASNSGLPRALCLLALLLAWAGCGVYPVVMHGNYLTYEHPFTDAGAEAARVNAGEECKWRKQVAVKTSSTCSLTVCTTNFQCMEPAEAKEFQQ